MPEANVLVVEDDDTIRKLLVAYLAAHASIAVDGARDGVEALHRISTGHYRVVLLDVMMPKMSGIDLLDSILAMRADPWSRKIEERPAVLIITAASDAIVPTSLFMERFPELVRGVFRKPLDVGALAAAVEAHLR